jgi:hypothetical protein
MVGKGRSFAWLLMYKFQQRLKNFKKQLRDWNKYVFGNIFQAQQIIEQVP